MTNFAEKIKKIEPVAVLDSFTGGTQEVLVIHPTRLVAVVELLQKILDFDILLDVIAIDWQSKKPQRFEVDYLFYNTKNKTRVQLKVSPENSDKPELDSLCNLFASANWAEREAYDMMGIHFRGHPNLKRLLMWEAFEGYPLRKDYPLQKRQPIPVLDELL